MRTSLGVRMLRVSKMADYATVIMGFFARHSQESYSAVEVSEHTHIALPSVRKVLKLLVAAHILISLRNNSLKRMLLTD